MWAHYQGKDHRMVVGVDDRWRDMLLANSKNMGVGSTGTDIDDAMRSTTSDEEVKPRDDEVDPPNEKKAKRKLQRDVDDIDDTEARSQISPIRRRRKS